MKKSIVIVSLVFGLTACNQDEIARHKSTNDSLVSQLRKTEAESKEKEAAVSDFISSFNEVERNLDSVAARQQILNLQASKSRGDMRSSGKDRINAQIIAINDLMDNNRSTIADLKRKLKGSSRTNSKLKETLATLEAQLQQKDGELADLNEKLNSLSSQIVRLQTSVDTLTALNKSRSNKIEETMISLHTAYYVVGRSTELQAAKVIDRKGGVLGLGKTTQIQSSFDNSKFKRIDFTKITSIVVNSKDVKIVTSHPSDSYKLERDPVKKSLVRTLTITNPERFWSVSRYLVVQGDPIKSSNEVSDAGSANGGL
jgi:hypothetical protein